MPYEFEIDLSLGRAIIRPVWLEDVDELKILMEELVGDAKWRPGMGILILLPEMGGSDFLAADMQKVSDIHELLAPQIGAARIAIMAEEDRLFGLVRMFASLTAHLDFEARAFRTRAEAEAWLES